MMGNLSRPVRWGAHANLRWQHRKAAGAYPTISASSISLLMAPIWGKPTARNSWEVASVNGKPEPCANTTRRRKRWRGHKGSKLAHASRKKQGVDANAETQRFVKWNVGVSGIANERRSIQQKSSNA